MKKLVLAALLLVSVNANAATAVISGGKLIGFDDVNLTGFGLYDTRFHDAWTGDIYSKAFTDATGVDVINNFTGVGSAQGTILDFNPGFTFGCSKGSIVCDWITIYDEKFAPGGSVVLGGTFRNWDGGHDTNDALSLATLTRSAAENDGLNNNRIFLTWTPSNVSAVPVPAAAFMFAPALLGFLGFRRKVRA